MTTIDSTSPSSEPLQIDSVLDASGLNCPLPILKTKVALNRLQRGQILHVIATDPMAPIDFKAFCLRTTHDLVRFIEQPNRCEFFIRRG